MKMISCSLIRNKHSVYSYKGGSCFISSPLTNNLIKYIQTHTHTHTEPSGLRNTAEEQQSEHCTICFEFDTHEAAVGCSMTKTGTRM